MPTVMSRLNGRVSRTIKLSSQLIVSIITSTPSSVTTDVIN